MLGNVYFSCAVTVEFLEVPIRLRVLSNLPHLVGLNRTRVGSPSWCGLFGPVRMQQSYSGMHQKRTKQAYRDLLEEVVSVRIQTYPGAVHLW